MSRIDICVRAKGTGEILVNRGFCRDTHLRHFCENSPDPKVEEFAHHLLLGLDLSAETFEGFLADLDHTLGYLRALSPEAREAVFSFYKADLFDRFVEDLGESLSFLRAFGAETDLTSVDLGIV